MTIFTEARSTLDDKGFMVLPEILDSGSLALIRDWFERVLSRGASVSPSLEPEFEQTASGQIVSIRKIRRLFWHDISFWTSFIADTSIGDIAKDLVGPDATLILHAAFVKPAHVGSAVEPHQDQSLWAYQYPNAITLWMAIDPATPMNGCLEFFEGSHKNGLLPHSSSTPRGWHASVDVSATEFRAQKIPLSPGDAVVWHRYMLHASAENRSADNRLSMVMVFADAGQPHFESFDRFPLSLLASRSYFSGGRANCEC